MIIGVISDTHIPERAPHIPDMVLNTFKNADMILHAGDLTTLEVKEELESLAPTYCVQGNMDRLSGLNLPKSKVCELEGIKIGLNHGEVYPRGDTLQLKYIAQELEVDVLISGHTHWAFIKEVDGILMLNPGSATIPRLSEPSIMLLEIEKGQVDAQIIKVGDPCKAVNFKP